MRDILDSLQEGGQYVSRWVFDIYIYYKYYSQLREELVGKSTSSEEREEREERVRVVPCRKLGVASGAAYPPR